MTNQKEMTMKAEKVLDYVCAVIIALSIVLGILHGLDALFY